MASIIVMPKLGLTMTEGTLVKWMVQEGDTINQGDTIFEVETDKITNTVEAINPGQILKIVVQEGETVPTKATVAIVGEAGEDIADLLAEASAGGGDAPAPAKKEEAPAAAAAPAPKPAGGKIIASPAAKKIAKEKGVDLALVAGTGPKGRITIDDVEKFLESGGAAPAAAGAAPQADEVVPMSAMRKVIARRMSESHTISPTVTLDISVDMTNMKHAKAILAMEDIKVSYTDLLVKIAAATLMEFPPVNCSIDGDNIIFKHYVNMGVAVALPEGLIVPVVKNAHTKGLVEISKEIRELAEAARTNTLGPDALSGGTFTITNLGMYGIESFTPIINQPEVAILGVNAMQDTVVVVDGELEIRPIMKFSLTTDHRAIDGAVAAQFLAKFKKHLEKPIMLLV